MDRIEDTNFKPAYIHPEEEPNVDEINKELSDILKDLKNIDKITTETAQNFNDLMTRTKIKITSITDSLNLEKERQEDINILCNKFSSFSTVLNLNKEDFTGNLSYEDGIITAGINNISKVDFDIIDISGNGQEGNDFVYQNKQFLKDILDTSKQSAINDNNLVTVYEYQRITESSEESGTPIEFNKDSIEAECAILINSDKEINKLVVNSDSTSLILKEIYLSDNGISFKLDKEYNIPINNNQNKYNDQTYIYGSGIISVPKTKYVKLCFSSNGYTDDTIAYTSSFKKNDSITKKINIVESAKRHVIRINHINAYKNNYSAGSFLSKELITNPISYIALFCNEYTNSGTSIESLITYSLIINGKEHEIVPINSQRNGKKIIRMSSQSYKLDYTDYIPETIKSAKLKIKINTSENITPFISNLKILIGGSENE